MRFGRVFRNKRFLCFKRNESSDRSKRAPVLLTPEDYQELLRFEPSRSQISTAQSFFSGPVRFVGSAIEKEVDFQRLSSHNMTKVRHYAITVFFIIVLSWGLL